MLVQMACHTDITSALQAMEFMPYARYGHRHKGVPYLSADICTQVTCVERYERVLAAVNQVHYIQLQQRIH